MMETKWTMLEKVSKMLLTGGWSSALPLLSRSSSVPLLVLDEKTITDLPAIYRACAVKPVTLCVFSVFLPSRIFDNDIDSHLCGMVANLGEDNTFHFFDPNGDPELGDARRYEYVNGLFQKLKPSILACQQERLLVSTGTPLQLVGEEIRPIQTRQARLFEKHGVEYFGLCATLTTLLLYQYQLQEGQVDLYDLSDLITEDVVTSLTDFARIVWHEAPEAFANNKIRTPSSKSNADARLPHEKMQHLPVSQDSGSWSRHAGYYNNENHGFFGSEGSGWEDPRNVAESRHSANSAPAPRSGNKRQRQPLPNAYATADVPAVSSNSNNGNQKNVKKYRFDNPAETNSTVRRSSADVCDELEWLFTNTATNYTLTVRFNNAPNTVLIVNRERGGDKLKMSMHGGEDKALRTIFFMNARELPQTLELPQLTSSPLAVFARNAGLKSVTNTWGGVLWTRMEGFDQHNMSKLWKSANMQAAENKWGPVLGRRFAS